jgi:hypothetical protein
VIGFYLQKITGEKLEPLPQPPAEEDGQSKPETAPERPAEVPPKPDDN